MVIGQQFYPQVAGYFMVVHHAWYAAVSRFLAGPHLTWGCPGCPCPRRHTVLVAGGGWGMARSRSWGWPPAGPHTLHGKPWLEAAQCPVLHGGWSCFLGHCSLGAPTQATQALAQACPLAGWSTCVPAEGGMAPLEAHSQPPKFPEWSEGDGNLEACLGSHLGPTSPPEQSLMRSWGQPWASKSPPMGAEATAPRGTGRGQGNQRRISGRSLGFARVEGAEQLGWSPCFKTSSSLIRGSKGEAAGSFKGLPAPDKGTMHPPCKRTLGNITPFLNLGWGWQG